MSECEFEIVYYSDEFVDDICELQFAYKINKNIENYTMYCISVLCKNCLYAVYVHRPLWWYTMK